MLPSSSHIPADFRPRGTDYTGKHRTGTADVLPETVSGSPHLKLSLYLKYLQNWRANRSAARQTF
jgi:hypothetical protein